MKAAIKRMLPGHGSAEPQTGSEKSNWMGEVYGIASNMFFGERRSEACGAVADHREVQRDSFEA
jgi:hypothetical protein